MFARQPAVERLSLSQPLILGWQYSTNRTTNLTPATSSDSVYVPLEGGILISLRAADGQLQWQADLGGEISCAPLANQQSVFVASEVIRPAAAVPRAATLASSSSSAPKSSAPNTHFLHAISRASGVTQWRISLSGSPRGTLIANSTTIFGATETGDVFACDKQTGNIRWTIRPAEECSSLLTFDGTAVYVGNARGSLFALNQKTGHQLWRYRTQGGLTCAATFGDRWVAVGSAGGYVYALDQSTGKLRWRARVGASVGAVASVADGVVISSLDNYAYLLSDGSGDRRWKRRFGGRLAAQPLIVHETVLFTPLASDLGIVLDLRSGKPVNILQIKNDNITGASPVITNKNLIVTTRQAILAFSAPANSPQHHSP